MPSDSLFTLSIPMPSRPIHGKLPYNCYMKVCLAERVCLSVSLRLQRGHRGVIACLPDILPFGIAAVQSILTASSPDVYRLAAVCSSVYSKKRERYMWTGTSAFLWYSASDSRWWLDRSQIRRELYCKSASRPPPDGHEY